MVSFFSLRLRLHAVAPPVLAEEMLTQRDLPTPTDNLLGAFFTNVLSTSDGHLKGEPLEAGIKADLADSDAKTVVSNVSVLQNQFNSGFHRTGLIKSA